MPWVAGAALAGAAAAAAVARLNEQRICLGDLCFVHVPVTKSCCGTDILDDIVMLKTVKFGI